MADQKRKMTPDELRAALQQLQADDGKPWHYTMDAHGHPQPCHDFYVWAEWFETADRSICQDLDEDSEGVYRQIRVSTVFLGLDSSLGLHDGPPLLYETMIFGGPLDGHTRRYATRDAAIIGHQEVCAELRKALQG